MSDVTSAATPEQQKAAEAMGWIPPERFTGDPERFVDADKFIERGETVLPIVKKQLETTREDLAAAKKEAAETRALLKKANDAIDDLNLKYSAETQRRVDDARKDLKAAIRVAAKEGDLEKVVALTDELEELTDAEVAAKAEEAKKAAETKTEERKTEVPPVYPETQAWVDAHPWFETDAKRRAIYLGYLQAYRTDNPSHVGKRAFDGALRMMEESTQQQEATKVAGSRNNGDGSSAAAGGKKSYAALPAEAKQECDADAKRFVGKGKRYDTLDKWRAAYAETYFAMGD